jgi:hypothetical protein
LDVWVRGNDKLEAGASPLALSPDRGKQWAKRVHSANPKFKALELELRPAANGFRSTLEKIDEAPSERETEGELALLKSIRDQVARLRQDSSIVLHRLYSEEDSSGKESFEAPPPGHQKR